MALSNAERQRRYRTRAGQALRLVEDEARAERNARVQAPGYRHLRAWWLNSRLDPAWREMDDDERAAFLEWLRQRRNPP
jgi:hypothetical protein